MDPKFNTSVNEFHPEDQSISSSSDLLKSNEPRCDSPRPENSELEAVYTESTVCSEEFDRVLLLGTGNKWDELAAYRESMKNGASMETSKNDDVVDLPSLLISCAQAIAAADDCPNATELLKQIRQRSSPFGDGNQRLAHYFADALEARLAGIGNDIYKVISNRKTSAADFLKAYDLYLASCPFRRIPNYVSSMTIMSKADNATSIHIIDFGILYGFQWPALIQRIAFKEAGPPKLRITGIEFPQPGFRPAERIEETGRRLAIYAERFNILFEYQAIAKKWETILLEDLMLDKNDFLVVNCLYRCKNLPDETELEESSKSIVLNLIRKINPDIFIHGIVNGAYSAPSFVTRFHEVLSYFSALFDMLGTVVPREIPERLLIERDIFGREALNVIACEGLERVERPETYKQWQVRNLRAMFTQIPFEREIMKRSIEAVRSSYHQDFVIDEEDQWLLLGWKGRVIYALSCWTPT
ncbi:scarecrow-like protein 9 [Capsicum galapagoense]